MRDGTKLFTSVYIPKDAFTDGKTYPIWARLAWT